MGKRKRLRATFPDVQTWLFVRQNKNQKKADKKNLICLLTCVKDLLQKRLRINDTNKNLFRQGGKQ